MSADRERGSVPEFVLVSVIAIPLILGLIHLAVVMHVRNTLTSAASSGARSAAGLDVPVEVAQHRTAELVSTALASRFADRIASTFVVRSGLPMVEVRITARVPALGVFGPAVDLTVTGHAIRETAP